MRISYIRLVNVAGIKAGMNRDEIEINFDNCKTNIVIITGKNASGKSVIISSLTPFSNSTSLDERSSLPYIRIGYEGYKEIHYEDNKDYYVIKHYYKPEKSTHSVKSYFSKNGEELNKNGNVRSFLSLVEIHFGLTPDIMRLIRLGSNVGSFISLSPTKRKEYIGKMINEIDSYLNIHKKINDDIKVLKGVIARNSTNLKNCGIVDIMVEKDNLKKIKLKIKEIESDIEGIISEISQREHLMKSNSIDNLQNKKNSYEIKIKEFQDIEDLVIKKNLVDTNLDKLIDIRNKLMNDKIDINSKINSSKMMIDSIMKNIEVLEIEIRKVSLGNDIKSLLVLISELKECISRTPDYIIKFNYEIDSQQLGEMISCLKGINRSCSVLYSYGDVVIELYLKLLNEKKDINSFIIDQSKKNINKINKNDLKTIISTVFQKDSIITPNCDNEYLECPYYRIYKIVDELNDEMDKSYDQDTLNYLRIFSININSALEALEKYIILPLPTHLKKIFSKDNIINRIEHKLPLFDLSELESYISLVKEYEEYISNSNSLNQAQDKLMLYKKSGIETNQNLISKHREDCNQYKNDILNYQSELKEINKQLEEIDKQIILISKYNENKKNISLFRSELETINNTIIPLRKAQSELRELNYSLMQKKNKLNEVMDKWHQLEVNISEYERLVKEDKIIRSKFNDLSIILESVSTKKGIPVIYMKQYLNKIKNMSNRLLSLIYEDFRIHKFNVTVDTFEISYIKNGSVVPDVKYASQSEISLSTMALSFALTHNAETRYNILLLDEIDAGLDETNRFSFMKMLDLQMQLLKVEQVFIISHNLGQILNIPVDCIKLSDIEINDKLQNVIFE